MNLLRQILADKRREIDVRREALSLREIERLAADAPESPDFIAALQKRAVGLIAEVKRRSPSAGIIRQPFHPSAIARAYEAGGAQALSVLMDGPYFGGGEEDFKQVRESVSLPLLYKEFVIDPWQVAHARALGASAVLLIAAALPARALASLHACVVEQGLQPLVEVHDRREMNVALDLGATCIGINNRNLKTFETKLETTYRLAELAPRSVFLISESGIFTAEEVALVREAGARAVLVGESLLRQRNLRRAVRTLMGRAWVAS